jgi:hypothetical protein
MTTDPNRSHVLPAEPIAVGSEVVIDAADVTAPIVSASVLAHEIPGADDTEDAAMDDA